MPEIRRKRSFDNVKEPVAFKEIEKRKWMERKKLLESRKWWEVEGIRASALE